jgi:hypothetical protein
MNVLTMSAGTDVDGATKLFERKIGEKEIVCPIQSFIMIGITTA